MQDKYPKPYAIEPIEAAFKGAVFSMMVIGMFIALTEDAPSKFPLVPYAISVVFGFVASFAYFSYRKHKSQRNS